MRTLEEAFSEEPEPGIESRLEVWAPDRNSRGLSITEPSAKELAFFTGARDNDIIVHSARVDLDGKHLAYGMLRLTPELTFVPSGMASRKERAIALRTLMRTGTMLASRLGYAELLVLAENPTFARVMEKHYGFMSKDEKPLILEL